MKCDDKVLRISEWICRRILFFLLSVFVCAPLIGSFTEVVGIKWSWAIFVITIVAAVVLTYFLGKTKLFEVENYKELALYFIVAIFAGLIYFTYSPVLEIRQDPSVYALKANNLINYGTTAMPMDTYKQMVADGAISENSEYNGIINGTQYKDGEIDTDFYPGGAFFFAMVGKVAHSKMFFATTMIMVMVALVLFELLKRLLKSKDSIVSAIMTMAFMIAPLIVWFGRGTFCEPSALLFMLAIALMFFENMNVHPSIIMLLILSSCTARIDYILILFVGLFTMSFISKKWTVITGALSCGVVFVLSKVYYIYYNRITANNMKLIKYTIPLVVVVVIVSLLIQKYWKNFEDFYRSKFVKVLLFIFGAALLLLMFRNNITDNYQIANIHGKDIRTYAEEIIDLLCKVFPGIAIAGGFIGLYRLASDEKVDKLVGIFLLCSFVVYSYFLIGAGNSPQLYWMLRRYYNVIIPILFISYVNMFKNIGKTEFRVLAIVTLALSANQFYDSNQIVDYEDLDKEVVKVSDYLENEAVDVVFYDKSSYIITAVVSYSGKDFVPVDSNELDDVYEWAKNNLEKKAVYITNTKVTNDYSSEFNVSYIKQGEKYGDVPKSSYDKNAKIFVYDLESIKEYYTILKNGVFFDGQALYDISGEYYEDGWFGKEVSFSKMQFKVEDLKQLVISRNGYNNAIVDKSGIEGLNLKVTINNIVIDKFTKSGNDIIIDLAEITKKIDVIESIKVESNTFVADNGDKRELSLDVNAIYFVENK